MTAPLSRRGTGPSADDGLVPARGVSEGQTIVFVSVTPQRFSSAPRSPEESHTPRARIACPHLGTSGLLGLHQARPLNPPRARRPLAHSPAGTAAQGEHGISPQFHGDRSLHRGVALVRPLRRAELQRSVGISAHDGLVPHRWCPSCFQAGLPDHLGSVLRRHLAPPRWKCRIPTPPVRTTTRHSSLTVIVLRSTSPCTRPMRRSRPRSSSSGSGSPVGASRSRLAGGP
jgi:hypothetical protein